MNTNPYSELTIEELIKEAVHFVRLGRDLPNDMANALKKLGIYNQVVYPLSLSSEVMS